MSVCTARGDEAVGFFTPCKACACGEAVRTELVAAVSEPEPTEEEA